MTKEEGGGVLVVDDTPANLRLLSEMLAKRGYRVRPALSGKLALRAANLEPPDLVLLDINMPDMDGYEVCRQLKENEALRKIPVIFISALQETDSKVEAFRSGGVDYITKPFQFDEVVARVETHLTLRRIREELEGRNVDLSDALIKLENTMQAHMQLRSILSVSISAMMRQMPQLQHPLILQISELIEQELGGSFHAQLDSSDSADLGTALSAFLNNMGGSFKSSLQGEDQWSVKADECIWGDEINNSPVLCTLCKALPSRLLVSKIGNGKVELEESIGTGGTSCLITIKKKID